MAALSSITMFRILGKSIHLSTNCLKIIMNIQKSFELVVPCMHIQIQSPLLANAKIMEELLLNVEFIMGYLSPTGSHDWLTFISLPKCVSSTFIISTLSSKADNTLTLKIACMNPDLLCLVFGTLAPPLL